MGRRNICGGSYMFCLELNNFDYLYLLKEVLFEKGHSKGFSFFPVY